MGHKFINNFATTLQSSLATGATTASLLPAEAAKLAALSPSVSDPVQLTIIEGSDLEIVSCTAANGTTGDITLVREQESTSAPASFPSGSYVGARITAEMLSGLGGSGSNLPATDYGDRNSDFSIDGSDSFAARLNLTGNVRIDITNVPTTGHREYQFIVETDSWNNRTIQIETPATISDYYEGYNPAPIVTVVDALFVRVNKIGTKSFHERAHEENA